MYDCFTIGWVAAADGWTLCAELLTEQQEDQEQKQKRTPGVSEDRFSSYKQKHAEITAEHTVSAHLEVTGAEVIAGGGWGFAISTSLVSE